MNFTNYKVTIGATILCLISAVVGFSQTTDKAQILPVAALEREIKSGETHGYKINLKTGKFLRVRIEQRGVDIVVRVVAPGGKLLVERDRPNGRNGEESLAAEAPAAGEYLVEMAALEKDAPVGKYDIGSDAPRQPTVADKRRIAAETARDTNRRIVAQGVGASLIAISVVKPFAGKFHLRSEETKSNEHHELQINDWRGSFSFGFSIG